MVGMLSWPSQVILVSVIGYLVGSLPTGYWLVWLVSGRDIREFGSGNIGATNVARMMGPMYFPIVFFIDSLMTIPLM